MRNNIAEAACAPQQTMATLQLNWSLDVAERARITNRSIALSRTATARVSDALIALNTLILAVSLVLLPGAVWMHAT
ncbi:MAG: hypothetical protein FD125_748 [bacterium]|nr:MAG: hypothetical protein FD125_748 [bacterium]